MTSIPWETRSSQAPQFVLRNEASLSDRDNQTVLYYRIQCQGPISSVQYPSGNDTQGTMVRRQGAHLISLLIAVRAFGEASALQKGVDSLP